MGNYHSGKSIARLAEFTHRGGRESNEDSLGHVEIGNLALLILADGMGGHTGGACAAHSVCENTLEMAKTRHDDLAARPDIALPLLIRDATTRMLDHCTSMDDSMDPHTTVVAVLVLPTALHVCHAGDSRCYLMSDDRPLWRTRDHSISQLLVDQGEIDAEQLRTHPDQNRLYRFLGRGHRQIAAGTMLEWQDGDTLLLCSDGLWVQCTDEEIAAVHGQDDLDTALAALCRKAVERGGDSGDNISAIAARLKHP